MIGRLLQPLLVVSALLLAFQAGRFTAPPPAPSFSKADCPPVVHCAPCAPCPEVPVVEAKTQTRIVKSAISDGLDREPVEEVLDTFMDRINRLCTIAVDNQDLARKKLAIATYIFCIAHVKQFSRGYDYSWDNTESLNHGYYRGQEMPPGQMSILQYFSIVSTIVGIPHKPIRDGQMEHGDAFSDDHKHYIPQKKSFFVPPSSDARARGSEGPRTLFWGCGSDTPMYVALTDYLGGTLTVVDDNPTWGEKCREMGANELYIVNHTGTVKSHIDKLTGLSKNGDDNVEGSTKSQHFDDEIMPLPNALLNEDPFDVIVVDGPVGGNDKQTGRSQSLYNAVRMAQSYSKTHYTNIFFHDASRFEAIFIANWMLGHHPATYVGNVLPRKGLKHWRVPGQDRSFNPPTF